MDETLQFAQVMTVIVLSTAGFTAIILGARVLWRMGSRQTPAALARHEDERMQRLETAVDTIAIEVERISEAQRFMVGLLGSGATASRSPAESARG